MNKKIKKNNKAKYEALMGKEKLMYNLRKQEEDQEEIQEEDQEEEKQKDLNFIIINNNAIFVDKITKIDKKSGKYITGRNYENGQEVAILDKDYGQSGQLMRLLLQKKDEARMGFIKKILIATLILFIFGVLVFIVLQFVPKTDNKNILATQNPAIQKVNNLINNGKGTPAPKIEAPKNIIKTFGPPIKSNDQINYEIKASTDEVIKLQKENKALINKNVILEEKIKKLEIEAIKCDIKKKDTSLNGFKMFLGSTIYTQCEKTEKAGNINKCKDLYYNYVKNDKGSIK